MDGEMLGNGTIVHEVKRVGLLIDRYVDLELRIGDHLVIYISKSQAWWSTAAQNIPNFDIKNGIFLIIKSDSMNDIKNYDFESKLHEF